MLRSAAATSPSAGTGTALTPGNGAVASARGAAGALDGTERGSVGLNSQTRWFRLLSSIVISSILPDFPLAFTRVSPGRISRPGLLVFHSAATVPTEIFSTTRMLLLSNICASQMKPQRSCGPARFNSTP